MTSLRLPAFILTLVLVSFLAVRPAHAVFGVVGWLGYGHIIVQDGEDNAFGPTFEVGGSFSVPFIALDVTYWNDLDDASEFSQLRAGGRLKPPLFPLYGRLALGVPLDGDVRDALGADIILGAGFEALSLPLLKLNVELDYHYWTDTGDVDIHPIEAKVGLVVGF